MSVDTIFFDLDSTLYPEENGLWSAIRSRIDLYLLEVMKISAQEIPSIRQRFLAHHGTTLKGLQIHYQIDTADYLRFVHDLPLHDYLAYDPGLREILLSLPSRRWIFTNSDADHANRVMAILGITDCFQGLIDIWKLAPYCKPEEAAYQRALALAGDILPEQCALVDDSLDNLAAAKKVGFFTVLVGKNGSCTGVDRCLETIHELPQMVPEFWHR